MSTEGDWVGPSPTMGITVKCGPFLQACRLHAALTSGHGVTTYCRFVFTKLKPAIWSFVHLLVCSSLVCGLRPDHILIAHPALQNICNDDNGSRKSCKILARAWMTSLPIFELPFYGEVAMLSNLYNLHLLQWWWRSHYLSLMTSWKVARWNFPVTALWSVSSLSIFRNNKALHFVLHIIQLTDANEEVNPGFPAFSSLYLAHLLRTLKVLVLANIMLGGLFVLFLPTLFSQFKI